MGIYSAVCTEHGAMKANRTFDLTITAFACVDLCEVVVRVHATGDGGVTFRPVVA